MASENMSFRIKELRKAKGLTLEEVGDMVGVGKSTVRKWETGIIANMKRDKIAALAKALDTTPAYLMGWKEEEKTPEKIKLNEGEEMLLDLFRRIPVESQPMVLEMIKVVLKQNQ